MAKIDFHNVHTMIGADAVIDGGITLEGGTIIYGLVKGDIKTGGPVRIARTGEVVGNISASDVHIGGTVIGNVFSSNRAELGQQSRLMGNLTCKRLLIEEGAAFEGTCDMPTDSMPAGESPPED